MSWRTVVIGSNAKLDYKMEYLVVRTLEEVKRIHLSEIGVLILESTAVSLTSYLMCELVQRKIKVIVCDHERNPCAELIPTCGCHDGSAKIHQQLKWSEGHCKQVWTEIVRRKIQCQKNHLERRGFAQAEYLEEYLEQLQWNDSTNREGLAAKVYFGALFGGRFTRTEECPINAALNYGYSLLLSVINREISAAGYLNQLGICHQNTYNPFNFGCDLIEPLRPIVDSAVTDLNPQKFEKEEKLVLLGLFNKEVQYDGKKQYLLYAIRLYCNSIFRSLESGEISEIKWIEYGR